MKEKVKALWKRCFDDSNEFVEMYFRLRYTDEVNVSIEREGEVISALQMLPYPMTFCGKSVSTSYISGACTHPDFRSGGVMRELLSQSFRRMQDSGIYFSTLIPAEPWLFDYYAKMGYTPVFQYSVQEVVIPEGLSSPEITVYALFDYQEKVYRYLNKKLSERPCCIQHTPENFQAIVADLNIGGDHFCVAEMNHEIKGVAIVRKEGDQLVINELFAENQDAKSSLLLYIQKEIGSNPIKQLLPLDDNRGGHPLGMARIIHAKRVLQLYASAFPETQMKLKLSDQQLPENSGYYDLSHGECTFSTEQPFGTYPLMEISDLTLSVLQPLHPYMSLMLN